MDVDATCFQKCRLRTKLEHGTFLRKFMISNWHSWKKIIFFKFVKSTCTERFSFITYEEISYKSCSNTKKFENQKSDNEHTFVSSILYSERK